MSTIPGVNLTDTGGLLEVATSLELQSDGIIVLAGFSFQQNYNQLGLLGRNAPATIGSASANLSSGSGRQ